MRDFKRDWDAKTANNADLRPMNRYIWDIIKDRHTSTIEDE